MSEIPSAREVIDRALDHVVGKQSIAWMKWIALHGYFDQDTEAKKNYRAERLHTALLAALLSCGAPPHPQYLTQDLIDCIPIPNRNIRLEAYKQFMVEHEQACKEQFPWNRRFNEWIIKHHMYGDHKGHGPAQFRKLFAAWLHACKEGQ